MRLIRLPWPDKALHANGKAHFMAKARATKAARQLAWATCKEARVPRGSSARLSVFFYPKERGRLPDLANCPAMVKAYIDGIADAVGCDDAHFTPVWPEELCERVEGGAVLIEIEVME